MAFPPPKGNELEATTSAAQPEAPSSPPARARRFSRSSRSSTTINDDSTTRPDFTKHESTWGEEVHVGHNVSTDDPSFPALKRALTGSRHEDDWSLEKQLKGAKNSMHQQGVKDKRLDVAWKNLSVRGIGAEAVFGETIGRCDLRLVSPSLSPFPRSSSSRSCSSSS